MHRQAYNYADALWTPSPTAMDYDSFFHSAFGTRTDDDTAYFDKHAKFRRMRWATFLTYYQNESMPDSLAEVLERCLNSNEKYKDRTTGDNHLENYIWDIVRTPKNITAEEIVLLATLENVKVTVFSNGKPQPLLATKPRHYILGDYLNAEKPKDEVVLCLEGNTFCRLETVLHEENSNNTISIPRHGEESNPLWIKYEKLGTAGSKGIEYQVGVLTVFLLNSLRNHKHWRLSTENKAAGKFDDVVLECLDGDIILQTKHKENKTKITLDNLMSVNTQNDDFSLPKYFLSYQKVKTNFHLKHVIICTNSGVDSKILKLLKSHNVNSQSMLYYGQSNCTFYTFNDQIMEPLRKSVRNYYETTRKNKSINEAMITDENLTDFLNHLQLYCNYPIGNKIEAAIEELLSLTKRSMPICCQISSPEIYSKVMCWYQQKNGVDLNEIYATALLSEILRDQRWKTLEEYDVKFQTRDLHIPETKKITHVNVEKGHLLYEIKICSALKSLKAQILHICWKDKVDILKQVIDAFSWPTYTYLIIVRPKVKQCLQSKLGNTLENILNQYQYKRLIIVEGKDGLLPHITLKTEVIEETLGFQDLSMETQDKLLEKKRIVFQGEKINLRTLITEEHYAEMLNPNILEMLIRNEKIKVGTTPLSLGKDIARFYVDRKFDKLVIGNDNKQREIISESSLYDVNDKVVLISDQAGTGKTTALTRLSGVIKKKQPHLWVIRIQLNDYTNVLKGKRSTISIGELLDSRKATKLTTQFEKDIFSLPGKVVIMLDGVDEVSPDYNEVILKMLVQCQKDANFAKIFVTTRPHIAHELKQKLKTNPFVLLPFTEGDQINFLTKYWSSSLKLDKNTTDNCRQYSKQLIRKLSSSWISATSNGYDFAAVPLQVKMLAEVFQQSDALLEETRDWDGCKEYLLIQSQTDARLPPNMNIAKLYDLFLKKKQKVFVEKGNPYGNAAAKLALIKHFNDCLVYHSSLALESILGERKCKLFRQYLQSNAELEASVLMMGIVHKLDSTLQFVHRTFGEYFVAKALLTELQGNGNVEFQRFFIDTVLTSEELSVICSLLDSLLQAVELSSNTFQKYMSLKETIRPSDSSRFELLHRLAGKGWTAILKLILKCIGFRVVLNKYEDLINTVSEYSPGNTLSILKYFTEKAGVNIIDENHMTPLHVAIRYGHLDMVKILVDKGADVKRRPFFTFEPLWLAIYSGNFDIFDLLVQKGSDIGYTILKEAVDKSRTDIANYLLDLILGREGFGITDLLIPYAAAYTGRLKDLELLLRLQLKVNSRLKNGETLIFGAVKGKQLDAIRFLMRYGAKVNSVDGKGNAALHLAAKNGSTEVVVFLVDRCGADTTIRNRNGYTAMHLACTNYHSETATYLVKLGGDHNAKDMYGRSVLHYASQNGWLGMVRILLTEHRVDVNLTDQAGQTAVHVASANGWVDVLEYLVAFDADPACIDKAGRTGLHLAALKDQLDAVSFLVTLGVDVSMGDRQGLTPLHLAVLNGSLRTLRFFAQHGIDFDVTDRQGRTALDLAVGKGEVDIVEILLDSGANVNVKDMRGRTVLHSAVSKGDLKTARLLVARGVDVDVKDDDGCVAMDLIDQIRHARLAKFLMRLLKGEGNVQ